MKHLIQYSTGAASAEVASRAVEEHGPGNVILLSADTLVEDQDNWRFADEVAQWLGCEWIILADGRTPMQVGRDEGLVPNNRMAVCSRILKRELLREFIDRTYDPADSVVYLGFDWSEPHRFILSADGAVSCSCLNGEPLAPRKKWGPGESIKAWHDLHPRDTDGRFTVAPALAATLGGAA